MIACLWNCPASILPAINRKSQNHSPKPGQENIERVERQTGLNRIGIESAQSIFIILNPVNPVEKFSGLV
jgi:hypothetical protein